MAQQCPQDISSKQDFPQKETRVENCFLHFSIKDFKKRALRRNTQLLGKLKFRASDEDDFYTLWHIKLISRSSGTGEGILELSLTRLKSENRSNVFGRFCWIIPGERENIFPLTIHENFSVGDKASRELNKAGFLERYCDDGHFSFYCELTVFDQHVEEYISSEIAKHISSDFKTLSSDMNELLQSQAHADIALTTKSESATCQKAVLLSRSSLISEWLENVNNENGEMHIGDYKPGVLSVILEHVYRGINGFYLKHTIPNGLKECAEVLRLSDLRDHIDHVSSVNIATLHTMHATWKIYDFKKKLNRSYFCMSSPKQESQTLFDKTWKISLKFDNPEMFIGIYFAGNAYKRSKYDVHFNVEIKQQGKTTFQTADTVKFSSDEKQEWIKIITADEIKNYLTENKLVLKSSINIIPSKAKKTKYTSLTSALIDSFTSDTTKSLQNLSANLKQLFRSGSFSDAGIETKNCNLKIHSCILISRLQAPLSDITDFLKNIDPKYVEPFILYLYSAILPMPPYDSNRDSYIIKYEKMIPPEKNIMKKYLEFSGCNTGKDCLFPVPDLYREDSIIRTDTSSHLHSLIYNENASSEQNNMNRNSKDFEHKRNITEDNEGEVITENPITRNPSYTQEQCLRKFALDIGNSTTKEKHHILSPQSKYGRDLSADQDTYEDLSVFLANSCNIDIRHPTGKADCEDKKLQDNTFLQQSPLLVSDNSSRTSIENNKLHSGIILHNILQARYSYIINISD